MAQGYRITESGDLRVTEESSTRISEQFHVLSTSLSASSSLTGSATANFLSSTSLSNVGSVLYAGNVTRPTEISYQATGTASFTPTLISKGVSDLTAASTQQALGLNRLGGELSVSAIGTQASVGKRVKNASGSYSASSTLASSATRVLRAEYDTQQDNIIRLSELGDTRITEDGNVRVASNANVNSVYGNIVANGDSFPFEAVAYIKENGVWVEFDPYVKWGGDWTLPEKVYKKVSDRWRRVY